MGLLTVVETGKGIEVRHADRAVFSLGRFQEHYTLKFPEMQEEAQLKREDFKELGILDDLLILRYRELDGWKIRNREITLGMIEPSEPLQRAVEKANENGTYFLDVGGLRIDVNDFWPYPWLQRPQERGYTHVRAGEGRWMPDEYGRYTLFEVVMIFDGGRADFEAMIHYRSQVPDTERGRPFDPDAGVPETSDLVRFQNEAAVQELLRKHNVALRERVAIDDVLRGQDGVQIMMGIDPPRRYDP